MFKQRTHTGQASVASSAVVQTVSGLVSLSLYDLNSESARLPVDSSYSEMEHCAASLQHNTNQTASSVLSAE